MVILYPPVASLLCAVCTLSAYSSLLHCPMRKPVISYVWEAGRLWADSQVSINSTIPRAPISQQSSMRSPQYKGLG